MKDALQPRCFLQGYKLWSKRETQGMESESWNTFIHSLKTELWGTCDVNLDWDRHGSHALKAGRRCSF